MNVKQLIGQNAIRTKPTINGDHSYSNEPLLILNVTENHIIYIHLENSWWAKSFSNEPRILDLKWMDDNWINYDKLIEKSKSNMRAIKIVSNILSFHSAVKRKISNFLTKSIIIIFNTKQFLYPTTKDERA